MGSPKLIMMSPLWLMVFISIWAPTSSVRVLNVNWKCTDGAPCLNVVRPRGAFALVPADQESFKLAISVHRPELARERILKKWSSGHGTIWNVEVTWFRLVEKGVRISMQHCKYKLVCVIPLLDDEAMARDKTFFDTGLVSHHFLVTAKYEGHRAASEQEIIIEREASGSYEDFQSPTDYKDLAPPNQPQQPLLPPSISRESPDKFTENIKTPSNIDHSDLQRFMDDKKQKASRTLINSGLYSDSDEVDMIPSLYPVEDAPGDLPPQRSNLDQNTMKIIDSEPNHNTYAADNEGTVVILPKNKTSGVSEQVKGLLTGVFIRLGPTATVIIVLVLAIIMAFLCTCGANRIMKRYHSKGTRDYIKMKENEADKTKQSKKPNSADKKKQKPPSPRDTSWFRSKYKGRLNKNGVPDVSAGIQETFATYSKAVGKFLRGGHATDEAAYQPLVNDGDDDDEYKASEGGNSQNLGFRQKIKKTGSRIFERIQSNEQFRHFKTSVRDNPVFAGGKNAAKNMIEGEGIIRNPSIKKFCNKLTECIATLLRPFLHLCRYIFDCCFGWCKKYHLNMREQRNNAKVRAFMPSRGPSASTSSSDDDSSSDEVNVYTKGEKRIEKKVTFCLVNENKREERHDGRNAANELADVKNNNTYGKSPLSKRIAPKTDISGRFNCFQPVKIFRDSGQGTANSGQKKVLYPSAQASRNNRIELTVTKLQENAQADQLECKEHHLGNKVSFASLDSAAHSMQQHGQCGADSNLQLNLLTLPAASKSQDQKHVPSPPHLHMRISRTPPPIETSSSASSEAVDMSSIHEDATTSSNCDSSEHSKTLLSELTHGDNISKKSDLTALERTKEYYRLEKQQMNKLLRVWEARTRPRKMVIDTAKQGRSREWLSHERRRRRQLRLQQEARFVRNNDAKKASVRFPNATVSRATCQKILTVGNRLRTPTVDKDSGTPAGDVSAEWSSFSSASKQSQQASSSAEPLVQSEIIEKEQTYKKSEKSRLCSESDNSDVSISSLSTRSMETSEGGNTSVSISLTDSSVSVTQESSQKQHEKIVHNELNCNLEQIDKNLGDTPITSDHNEAFTVESQMTLETQASEKIILDSDQDLSAQSMILLDKQCSIGASIAENLVWKKLEASEVIEKEILKKSTTNHVKEAAEMSTLQSENDFAQHDASTSAQLINSHQSIVPKSEASLSPTSSRCSQDQAIPPPPRHSNENSTAQSSDRIKKEAANFALEINDAVTDGSRPRNFKPGSMHTIVEIPESDIMSEQASTSSSVCSPQQNLKRERKKSPSFNPFTFWKKDKTDSSMKKHSLHDQDQRKRSTSNSPNKPVDKVVKKSGRTTRNKTSPVQDLLVGTTPKSEQDTTKKEKLKKISENSKKKSDGCMSGMIANTRNSIDRKPSSILKTNSTLSNNVKFLKSSSGCDVITPSAFIIEHDQRLKNTKYGKSVSINSTATQAAVVTTQPSSMRTSRCYIPDGLDSCQNIERAQTSNDGRLQNEKNIAGISTRKTRPIREPSLMPERQSSRRHTSTSERVPPLNFDESCSSNGDNEYLSIPNSPTDKKLSKTNDIDKNSLPFANSPRYYTMHPDTIKKLPPDRPTRCVTPRTALNSVAAEFLYEDDYESFASSDDNDEFWKVEV